MLDNNDSGGVVHHLLIIWQNGRPAQQKILDDLENAFTIRKVFEITWSPDRVSENFSRFYGVKLPSSSAKIRECGAGSFILVLFSDAGPVFEYRETSSGSALVNVNVFDRKQRYREWTHGSSRVHTSNDAAETRHDLMLLLGMSYDDVDQAFPVDNAGKI